MLFTLFVWTFSDEKWLRHQKLLLIFLIARILTCAEWKLSPLSWCPAHLSDSVKIEYVYSIWHCFNNLKIVIMSLPFFKLNIPNDFTTFISLEKRGWIGPGSHQRFESFQNLREEEAGLMVCEGGALDRGFPSLSRSCLYYLNSSLDFLTPSVGARASPHDKVKQCVKIHT